MTSISRGVGPLLPLLLCLLSMLGMVSAGDPEVTVSRFPNMPNKLFYFEDSNVVLMHDSLSSTVYRSADEGKSWKKVEDIGDGATRLIEHPHSKEVAFVIGRHEDHYVTFNRGETWQSFSTPTDPTLTSQPLSFHATKPDWILFQGTVCEKGNSKWGSGSVCYDETYYTTDSFRTNPKKMLSMTSECVFARSEKMVDTPENLVFCIAFESKPSNGHSASETRLFRSDDWFETHEYVDLGIGKRARGIVGLGVVSKFMIVAVKMNSGGSADKRANDPMSLFVSTDGVTWHQSEFPHSAMPNLVENAYTIVESTTHSIAIDILTSPSALIGTLFVSSGEGRYFVESLPDTNRNEMGIVDFEGIKGLDGVGIGNVVKNREKVVTGAQKKELQTWITFDDGSNWSLMRAPKEKMNGDSWTCQPSKIEECSLHVHSVTTPHNLGSVFSSAAPGFVMAVGSVGDHLLPYEECDTFLSTDAGVSWKMVQEGAHKYEFGDQGSVLVIADDEEFTDHVWYSYDGGAKWEKLDLGISVRVTVLTTIPDSTSQNFLIVGMARRSDSKEGRYVTVFLDFDKIQTRQCQDKDFERWYARGGEDNECIMGHKQWYQRRKLDAQCYVGNVFDEPKGHEENCACTDADFECDFNFVRQNGECVAAGPQPVPAGTCKNKGDTYKGSSGYRLIPGNTCSGGVEKANLVDRPCTDAKPEDGKVSHVVHAFTSRITRHSYFEGSQTILLQLEDNSIWQSSNEGYSWTQLEPSKEFLTFVMHPYTSDRAYLITKDRTIIHTTDTGRSWNAIEAPMEANGLGVPLLDFHPTRSDWLIFTGSVDCTDTLSTTCHAVAWYTTDHGRRWNQVEKYVRNCQWARDSSLKIDERMIVCESYKEKKGSQKSGNRNPIELIAGRDYYGRKEKLFDSVVGFTTFSQYFLAAKYDEEKGTLSLEVSLDGTHFSEAQFPPNMKIDNHAYTILESNTDSVFLHMTINSAKDREWGTIFKSNSNGTYYGLSIEHVNRDSRGYVDFEKMIGLDGIALVNVVRNPEHAEVSGKKLLQSRITHNDGGSWKPLTPPQRDSLGQPYRCSVAACGLQIHGYTERVDPKATYSSPSAVGLMIAVGNVGEELADYEDSDVFLTRDGGFTWEEVHKDAHLWEYGDSGSLIVLANDEEAVDHVLYTTDEGLTWHNYNFGQKIRVQSVNTAPQDTSRRFYLVGQTPGERGKSVLVHLDFDSITQRKCEFKIDDPNHDDFEVWSPAENREEKCLFGRQTLYHRRIRDRDCYIGEKVAQPNKVERNCTCTAADFECEFNHVRNAKGDCVLVEGAAALTFDTEYEQCVGDAEFWYDRTAYRKIPHSSCDGGDRPDRGKQHTCPGIAGASLGALFWASIAILPFACAGVAGWWWVTKGGRAGTIRLGEHRAYNGDTGAKVLNTLASVPYFILGVVAALWSQLENRVPFIDGLFRRPQPYRSVPIDDDAELLGQYED